MIKPQYRFVGLLILGFGALFWWMSQGGVADMTPDSPFMAPAPLQNAPVTAPPDQAPAAGEPVTSAPAITAPATQPVAEPVSLIGDTFQERAALFLEDYISHILFGVAFFSLMLISLWALSWYRSRLPKDPLERNLDQTLEILQNDWEMDRLTPERAIEVMRLGLQKVVEQFQQSLQERAAVYNQALADKDRAVKASEDKARRAGLLQDQLQMRTQELERRLSATEAVAQEYRTKIETLEAEKALALADVQELERDQEQRIQEAVNLRQEIDALTTERDTALSDLAEALDYTATVRQEVEQATTDRDTAMQRALTAEHNLAHTTQRLESALQRVEAAERLRREAVAAAEAAVIRADAAEQQVREKEQALQAACAGEQAAIARAEAAEQQVRAKEQLVVAATQAELAAATRALAADSALAVAQARVAELEPLVTAAPQWVELSLVTPDRKAELPPHLIRLWDYLKGVSNDVGGANGMRTAKPILVNGAPEVESYRNFRRFLQALRVFGAVLCVDQERAEQLNQPLEAMEVVVEEAACLSG
jgi:hypothetical protein